MRIFYLSIVLLLSLGLEMPSYAAPTTVNCKMEGTNAGKGTSNAELEFDPATFENEDAAYETFAYGDGGVDLGKYSYSYSMGLEYDEGSLWVALMLTENNVIQDEVGWVYISLSEMAENDNLFVESIEDDGEEFAVLTCSLKVAEEINTVSN